MAEGSEVTPQATTDVSGIQRTADGSLADQTGAASSPNTTQQTETTKTEQAQTEGKKEDGATLLTEGKKEEGDKKAPETKEGDKKETKAEGAPEKYEDYKLPEGFTLDAKVKTEADGLFKGMNLSQENAQKLVDFYTTKTQAAANAPAEAYKEMTDGWRKEAEDHPDLRGKLGPGGEVNLTISKALDSLGDASLVQDFKQKMDLTGAGNLAPFIRVLYALSKGRVEGSHVAGNGPSPHGQSKGGQANQPSAAQAMYPSLPSQQR